MKPANFDPTYQALLGGGVSIIASGVAGQSVFKPVAVRAATTAAGTLASDFENGDSIDGVTLATGDRILVKDQATGAENGIYVVEASGAPTRAADFDSSTEIVGAVVAVLDGTANGGSLWHNTNTGTITVDTTALTFERAATPSPLTTKGDLWGYDTADTRVPVGPDGYLLSADSTDAQGVAYISPDNVGHYEVLMDGSGTADPLEDGSGTDWLYTWVP